MAAKTWPTVDRRPITTTMGGLQRTVGPIRPKQAGELMRLGNLLPTVAVATACVFAAGQQAPQVLGIRAHLRLMSAQSPVGQPVWVQFLIENTTSEAITLTVPGTEPQIPSPEAGLPLAHVFSGGLGLGVSLTTESGHRWETPVGHRAPTNAPILMVAPHGTVGTAVDLLEYFPALRGAGRYRVSWAPYGGRVESETVVVIVAPYKLAEIVTDEGTLRLKFFYEATPAHVTNFIELARSGFYDGKTFHRIEPGYLLQGGCPRGDGTGIRPDGKRVPAEYSSRPHRKGSVSMALLDDDPESASCQFFISNTSQRDWDGRYTVFAELVGDESFETLDRLMATPVDELSRPKRTLYMRNVRIVDAPADVYLDNP